MKIFFALFLFLWPLVSHAYFRGEKERHKTIQEYYDDKKMRFRPETGMALIGDQSATKQRLAENGITVLSSFTTDMVANPSGGKARGFAYAGSYGLSVNIDFTPAGLKGLDLFSSAVWRTGTSLSQRKIGNQFPVQQVFGSQTVKLNELYLMQTVLNGNLAFKAGRLDAGNDFLASPLYWHYVNNGFNGNPISIFFNVPFTAYPNSTWGAYVFFKPHKRLSGKIAVYNANSNISKNKYHGVNFTFKSTNGVIWISEWCVLLNQDSADRGMPGNYKVGAFYLTGDISSFKGGQKQGDFCYYALFDQMVYRWGKKEGLIPFISLIAAPADRNLFPLYFNCGLVCQGLIPSRPDDSLNLGYIYGKYSWDQAKEQIRFRQEPQNFESILELNYWIQVTPWFYITPDVQYVMHPKGRHIPNAFCIGAQIGINIY